MAQAPTLEELQSRYGDADEAVSSQSAAQPAQSAVASDVMAAVQHGGNAGSDEDDFDSDDDRVINALDYAELHDGEGPLQTRAVRAGGDPAAA